MPRGLRRLLACGLDPGLEWLFAALSPLPPSDGPLVPPRFEYELPPEALNEQRPRVTSIDFLVETSRVVICTEAKRGEDGMDGVAARQALRRLQTAPRKCSTARSTGRPPTTCSECRIAGPGDRARSALAIRRFARSPRRATSRQPDDVRSSPSHDADNSYFRETGAWPGWPRLLEYTLGAREDEIQFRAISWQELLPLLPLDDEVRRWLRVKHRLG